MTIIRSFSLSAWYEKGGSFDIYEVEAVKEDILNYINTELGTRLYMPDFGTRIPTMTFEPQDRDSLIIIEQDVKKAIDYHKSRVELINLDFYSSSQKHTVLVSVDLRFIKTKETFRLNIEIEPKE